MSWPNPHPPESSPDPAAAAAECADQGRQHRGQPGADHGTLEVGWSYGQKGGY